MPVDTTYMHITSTPGIVGGKPRITGRRISVQNIVVWHERMGYSVDEIASQFDLTLSEVYSALAYYYDHKEAIDDAIAQGKAFAEVLRQETPSLLAQKLSERAS